MQIYVATEGGGKLGPLFLHQVEALLAEGKVKPTQLAWHRELPEWIPLRDIPAVREVLEARERVEMKARLDRESADGTIITRAQAEEAAEGKAVLKSELRPLARFSARVFDAMLVSSIVLFFVELPRPSKVMESQELIQWLQQPEHVQQFLNFQVSVYILGILSEAIFIAFWGTTPGKALFRIRLATSSGALLPFGRSLARASLVWIGGCGVWTACLAPITLPIGLATLLHNRRTWWDSSLAVTIHHSPLQPGRVLLILLAFYAIFLSFGR